uniref:Uncharacterized protein n=1 Tax=Anguilla anguilla TaxID=7936 RepID=A0A0E9VV88_ANGAN
MNGLINIMSLFFLKFLFTIKNSISPFMYKTSFINFNIVLTLDILL